MDHPLIRLHTLQLAANNLRNKIRLLERKLSRISKTGVPCRRSLISAEKLHQVTDITHELFSYYRQLTAADTIITYLMKATGN